MIVKPGSSEYDNTTKLCSEELVGNGLERSIEHDGLAGACAAPPVTVVVDQDDSEIGHPLIDDINGDGRGDLIVHVHRDDAHIKGEARIKKLAWY